MIPLYTQRTFGSKPRINDEITLPLWKGIVAFLEKMALYTTNFTELLSYQASAFLKLPEFP